VWCGAINFLQKNDYIREPGLSETYKQVEEENQGDQDPTHVHLKMKMVW